MRGVWKRERTDDCLIIGKGLGCFHEDSRWADIQRAAGKSLVAGLSFNGYAQGHAVGLPPLDIKKLFGFCEEQRGFERFQDYRIRAEMEGTRHFASITGADHDDQDVAEVVIFSD